MFYNLVYLIQNYIHEFKKENHHFLKMMQYKDLVQSLQSINNITKKNSEEIIIYLSERSKKFSFLIKKKNINVKILNYNLSLGEKIPNF